MRKARRDMTYNSTTFRTHNQKAGNFSAPPAMLWFFVLEVQGKILSRSSLINGSTTGDFRVREQVQHPIDFRVIHEKMMIATKQSMKRGTKTAQFSLSIDRSTK